MEEACGVAATCVIGFALRFVLPVLIIFALGWLARHFLGPNGERRNGKAPNKITLSPEMIKAASNGRLRELIISEARSLAHVAPFGSGDHAANIEALVTEMMNRLKARQQ